MNRAIVLIIPLLFLSVLKQEDKYFYYSSENDKVYLDRIDNKAVLLIKDDVNIGNEKEFLSRVKDSSQYQFIWRGNSMVDVTGHNPINLKNENPNIVEAVFQVYKTRDGLEMAVTNKVIVKFKPHISQIEKSDIISQYGLRQIKANSRKVVFMTKPGDNPLQISNEIYESGIAEYAHPDLLIPIILHRFIPNDSYFNQQITCHNTGQSFTDGHSGSSDADIDAPEAWDITKGSSSIVIAVLDQGVTSDHPDLPNSRQVRLNGSNFGFLSPDDPSPIGHDNHGNACAGVIAATMDNNQGIAGIAPNTKIMPLRWDNTTTSGEMADAIEFAVDSGANIISNSWGYGSTNPNFVPAIKSAIQYAIDEDVLVVFSAGNTANHASSNDGYIVFPSNVEIDGVLTVGASDRNDAQSNYSPTSDPSSGNNQIIDLVAPSHKAYSCQISGETLEMWSLDIPGSSGYNEVHSSDCGTLPTIGSELPSSGTNFLSYTARFGGTSHSCPVVVGVAALVLSMNTSLAPTDIVDILTNSADKIGGYSYNGSGWSEETGYGRVNAFKAIMESCPPGYTISWTVNTGENLTYQSGDFIEAQNEIETGADVTLKAVNSVKLKNGFHAKVGSALKLVTEQCSSYSGSRLSKEIVFNENDTKDSYNDSEILRNLIISPIPATNDLTVQFHATGPHSVEFTIIDLSGKIRKLGNYHISEGENSIELDLRKCLPGIYILKLTDDKVSMTKKIVIQ